MNRLPSVPQAHPKRRPAVLMSNGRFRSFEVSATVAARRMFVTPGAMVTGAVAVVAAFLRTVNLSSNPPPLADEILAAVDIHILRLTGRHVFGVSAGLLAHIIPILDGRYLLSFVSAADVTDLRVVSAAFGVATVALVVLIGRELAVPRVGYLAGAALAVMPWHIYLSRVYLPASEYLFLTMLAVLLLFRGARLASVALLTGSAVAGIASIYLYPIAIVATPLVLGGAVLFDAEELLRLPPRKLILPLVIATLCAIPYIVDHFIASDVATANTTISSKLIWRQGLTPPATAQLFASTWAGYLTPGFILYQGDPNPAHSIQTIGEVGWIAGLFGAVGMFVAAYRRTRVDLLVLFWLLVYPVADAITYFDAAGNSVRGIVGCVVWALLFGIGAEWVWGLLRRSNKWARRTGLGLASAALLLQVVAFASVYWGSYSQRYDYLFETGYSRIYATLEARDLTQVPITLHAGYAREAMLMYFSAYHLHAVDTVSACDELPYELAHPPTLPRVFVVKDDVGFASIPGCIRGNLPAHDRVVLKSMSLQSGVSAPKVEEIDEFPSDSSGKYFTAIFYVHK